MRLLDALRARQQRRRAIRRASETVHFYLELGGGGPLWVRGEGWDPHMFGVSRGLARDLRVFATRWAAFTEEQVTPSAERESAAQTLVERLRHELPPGWSVQLQTPVFDIE